MHMFFIHNPLKMLILVVYAFIRYFIVKENFLAPFGWGSTASKLKPLQGGSLLFTTKFTTHFIALGRMK